MKFKFKRAEGTASSMFMASFVALSIIIMFGLISTNLANKYNAGTVSDFDDYEGVYNKSKTASNTTVVDFDDVNEDGTSKVGGVFRDITSQISDWSLIKALKSVNQFRQQVGKSVQTLTITFKNLGALVPPPIRYLLFGLLGIMGIILIIRVMMRYDKI